MRALLSLAALAALAAGAGAGAQLAAPAAVARSSPAGTLAWAASSGLAVSRASAYLIQPQPRPDSCSARGSGAFTLPDPRCTPGAIDPAVTQANIFATICRAGYTRRVRPPQSVTSAEKRASLRAYSDSGPASEYEYDHFVPLELGGARNDPRNLWPQPGGSPNRKDGLENRLRELVCGGELSLAGAQRRIARDWVAEYRRQFG